MQDLRKLCDMHAENAEDLPRAFNKYKLLIHFLSLHFTLRDSAITKLEEEIHEFLKKEFIAMVELILAQNEAVKDPFLNVLGEFVKNHYRFPEKA